MLLDEPDAQGVMLSNFAIDGNKSNQKGSANAIFFDNTRGRKTGVFAHHLIRNVHVRDVAGSGLSWGYGMRASLVDGFTTYKCDGYGFEGNACSDNAFQNMDLGRSGLDGLYISTCSNSTFTNIKSWYSGELQVGSAGILVTGGDSMVFSSVRTQENSGPGAVIDGRKSVISGLVMRDLISDSDNTQGAASTYALDIRSAEHSVFNLAVVSKAPLQAKPFGGVKLTSSSRNLVVANIDPSAVTWELGGEAVGDNDVDLCRGQVATSTADGGVDIQVYQHRRRSIKLATSIFVDAPATPPNEPPIGLEFELELIQDDVGGHLVTWAPVYKLPPGIEFVTDPGTVSSLVFRCAADDVWRLERFMTGVPA